MRSSRVLDRTLSKAVGRQELLSDSRIIAKSGRERSPFPRFDSNIHEKWNKECVYSDDL